MAAAAYPRAGADAAALERLRHQRAADRADGQPLGGAGAQVAAPGLRVARRHGEAEQPVAELRGVHAQGAAGVGRARRQPAATRFAPCHSSQRQRRNGSRPGGSG